MVTTLISGVAPLMANCPKEQGTGRKKERQLFVIFPSNIFVYQKTKAKLHFRVKVSLVGNRAGQ